MAILTDFSLLRVNAAFRTIFIARTLSVFALGLLTVAVPVQVQAMTGSAAQVGLVVALGGAATFVGLLAGGVLADRFDRRNIILFARSVCGLGFAALAVNAFSASPCLPALYLLAAWDGFFSAFGMTALLAATPALVGRDNLAAAGALSMITVRLGGIVSPAVGGLIIVSSGVGWNYALAAAGTFLTLVPLVGLPSMPPQGRGAEHPARALLNGVRYLFDNRVVGAVVAVGTLVSLAGGVRVLFPALATAAYHGGPSDAGLMYSAVPLGATLGAVTSGWVAHLRRPGLALLLSSGAAFAAMGSLGLSGDAAAALVALAVYGYLGSITSLLQFTLVQKHTPDHLLGRINSLWTAQFISGDALGALGLGVLGLFLAPPQAVFAFGAPALLSCGLMAARFGALRGLSGAEAAPAPDPGAEKDKRGFAPSG